MKVSKTRILGSSYVGLFGIANNTLCIVARGTDKKVKSDIEEALDVKTIEAGIYDSNLIAVFAIFCCNILSPLFLIWSTTFFCNVSETIA